MASLREQIVVKIGLLEISQKLENQKSEPEICHESICSLCNTLGDTKVFFIEGKRTLKVRLETEDIVETLKESMAKYYGTRKIERNGQKGKKKGGKKMKIQEYYVLGQNLATSSILELVELLVERDYPQVGIFDGSKDGMLGSIFIPEGYLPKKPKVVDPDVAEKIKNEFPNDKKLLGAIKATEGDLLERKVYDALKNYFKPRQKEDVLIIQASKLILHQNLLAVQCYQMLIIVNISFFFKSAK